VEKMLVGWIFILFHAHGGHFWDIGCGNGMYDVVANEEKLKGYRPVLRDTTMLYRYADVGEAGKDASWRGWRLRVNQPGVYVIHCHILQHMVMGKLLYYQYTEEFDC